VNKVVRPTIKELPVGGAPAWTTRALANCLFNSHDSVGRTWMDHGLKPRKVDNLLVSTVRHLEEKSIDGAGRSVNPPERAMDPRFEKLPTCGRSSARNRPRPFRPSTLARCVPRFANLRLQSEPELQAHFSRAPTLYSRQLVLR
jgi:hypothetical protein